MIIDTNIDYKFMFAYIACSRWKLIGNGIQFSKYRSLIVRACLMLILSGNYRGKMCVITSTRCGITMASATMYYLYRSHYVIKILIHLPRTISCTILRTPVKGKTALSALMLQPAVVHDGTKSCYNADKSRQTPYRVEWSPILKPSFPIC